MAKSKDKEKMVQDSSITKIFQIIKNQKFLHLLAWLLLTAGLCITLAFLYMIIRQNYGKNNTRHTIYISGKLEKATSDPFPVDQFSNRQDLRSSSESYSSNMNGSLNGIGHNRCELLYCSVSCINVTDIYTALHEALQNTICLAIEILKISNQEFPNGVLRNNWFPTEITVDTLQIAWCNIASIESNAFNSALFKRATTLNLHEVNITKVESGAFVGFENLEILTILGHIEILEPAVMQPIETTLTNLRLNANLNLNGNENFLNGSLLDSLNELNLNGNKLNGSLSKNFFDSTPYLINLVMRNTQMEQIYDDALENIKDTLQWLDVSYNRISTLRAAVLKPFLENRYRKKGIRIEHNDYVCNCELEELANLIHLYNKTFIFTPRCKSPSHLQDKFVTEVDFRKENCSYFGTIVHDVTDDSISVTTPYTSSHESTSKLTTTATDTLKMVCLDNLFDMREKLGTEISENRNYLLVPPPNYDIELKLITENNSVIVSINNSADVLVIWFSDQLESSVVVGYDDESFDYECMRYAEPELIVGPLQDNTTYTFCLLPSLEKDISPFNCLPLFVPPRANENIWISNDKRYFTIGMLCLIFLLSTIAGGLIAYFGIKTYPHLLEGSKNVLVVKQSNHPYYIATISDTIYQEQSCHKKNNKPSLKKLRLPEIPEPDITRSLSVQDLEGLSSLKSTSTCLEDIPPRYSFHDNDYEIPKVSNSSSQIEQRNSVSNTCYTAPSYPPPLPKRNSYLRVE